MQGEIDALHPGHEVRILGINEIGEESGNDGMCEGREIPWLQETQEHPCWGPWGVTYRDVVICDPDNERAAVYNVTVHNLSVGANYDSLKSLIMQIANQ